MSNERKPDPKAVAAFAALFAEIESEMEQSMIRHLNVFNEALGLPALPTSHPEVNDEQPTK